MPVRLLFVCLGNICRSPSAEGVMRSLLEREGLQEEIEVDSAGTGGWHVGSAPDSRARSAAHARGIVVEGTARQVRSSDFDDFDVLLAMDRSNVRDLRAVAPDGDAREKVRLLREFDPRSVEAGELEVPDPYYGGGEHFDEVLDLVQAACAGLLEEIRAGRLP
ncbi:MAG TPA: low molecular weight protein-tyrosine-phosphatase [Solirubrobacteraceae bacterium]|jgi:protein-tyrosine phosphatase|nr:low molecular weight protein-tyrosine-phosphatase [Solirubrobacteraceae bacterium]